MRLNTGLSLLNVFALGACSAPINGADGDDTGYLARVPDSVLALAAPYQNLDAVVLNPEDGCYWYRHNGPVETTLLPLRTVEGRPICTRAQT